MQCRSDALHAIFTPFQTEKGHSVTLTARWYKKDWYGLPDDCYDGEYRKRCCSPLRENDVAGFYVGTPSPYIDKNNRKNGHDACKNHCPRSKAKAKPVLPQRWTGARDTGKSIDE